MKKYKNYYAFFLFVTHLLTLYGIPGSMVHVRIIFIIFTILFFFMACLKKPVVRCDMVYIPLFIYILLQSIMVAAVYNYPDVPALVLSVGQYLCYYIILIFVNPNWFDKKTCIKYMLFTADISTIYIIVQEVTAVVFGIYLPQGLFFLPMLREEITSYVQQVTEYASYRPRSLFSEPAEYVIYAVAALVVNAALVRAEKKKEKRIQTVRTLLYVIGIIISRSTSGFLTLAALAVYFLYAKYIKGNAGISRKVLIVLPLLVLGIVAASQTMFIQYQFKRLNQTSLLTFIEREPRIRILLHLDALDMTSWYKLLLGHDFDLGLYQSEWFMNSFFRQLYCFGVVGEGLLIFLLVRLWKRTDQAGRYILFAFILAMLAGGSFHGGAVLLYFSWLLPTTDKQAQHRPLRGNTYTPVVQNAGRRNREEE